jgi:hypothetical protein
VNDAAVGSLDQTRHLKTGDAAHVFRRAALVVIEISGSGDDVRK